MEGGPIVVIQATIYLPHAHPAVADDVELEVKSVCCINGGVVFV